jgi:hypothetical protein
MNAMDIFQKIVTPGRLRLWTQGDELLTGFVARRADTAWAQTPSEIRDAHGYATSDPSFAGSPFVDVLRFASADSLTFVAATGVGGEGFIEPAPFTGTGFVPTERGIVPLWWVEPTRVPPGSELWRIHPDGREEFLSLYANVASGWQPGHGRALPSDVCGRFARWNGGAVLADVLENGRVVLASYARTEDAKLTERGLWAWVVDATQIEQPYTLRLTARYKDLPFQVVRRWNDGDRVVARLVYLGRDATRAGQAGLERTDAGVYEVTAALEELTDVRGEELAPSRV